MECYLDNSATTRVDPDVVKLMNKIMLEDYGNPASLHSKGFEAEKHIKRAKEILSGILKCKSAVLFFISHLLTCIKYNTIGTQCKQFCTFFVVKKEALLLLS